MARPRALQARLPATRGIIKAVSGFGPAYFVGIDEITLAGAAQPVALDEFNTIPCKMTLSLFESVVHERRAVVTALA